MVLHAGVCCVCILVFCTWVLFCWLVGLCVLFFGFGLICVACCLLYFGLRFCVFAAGDLVGILLYCVYFLLF